MTNRDLDVKVAGLLGLEVLGEAPCYQDAHNTWYIFDELDHECNMQPIYLLECRCDFPLYRVKHFGHTDRCLEAVPLYHKDDTLALKALEHICDERQLLAIITYAGGYTVRLIPKKRALEDITVYDKSFSLAIVKALAGLEK